MAGEWKRASSDLLLGRMAKEDSILSMSSQLAWVCYNMAIAYVSYIPAPSECARSDKFYRRMFGDQGQPGLHFDV